VTPVTVNPAPRAEAIRALRQWLADGRLKAGEPLPSERALAQALGVPRATARRAIEALAREGQFGPCRGRTRLVTAVPPPDSLMRQAIIILGDVSRPLPQIERGGFSNYVGLGAQARVQSLGYHALHIRPDRLDGAAAAQLAGSGPVGILVPEGNVQHHPAELLAALAGVRAPVVMAGDASELARFDRVVADHEAGAYLLCRHFLELGKRRILLALRQLGPLYWTTARAAGYRRAMAEAGLEPLPTLAAIPFDDPRAIDDRELVAVWAHYWAGYLFPHLTGTPRVEAILTTNDGDALYTAAACRLLGLDPERDVLIAGYDNFWGEAHLRPYEPACPAATIDRRNYELGAAMVDLLLARRAGQLPPAPQRRLIAPRLVLAAELRGQPAAPR
jgi:DNA-binding LacI/PurR family transcriptional regulator